MKKTKKKKKANNEKKNDVSEKLFSLKTYENVFSFKTEENKEKLIQLQSELESLDMYKRLNEEKSEICKKLKLVEEYLDSKETFSIKNQILKQLQTEMEELEKNLKENFDEKNRLKQEIKDLKSHEDYNPPNKKEEIVVKKLMERDMDEENREILVNSKKLGAVYSELLLFGQHVNELIEEFLETRINYINSLLHDYLKYISFGNDIVGCQLKVVESKNLDNKFAVFLLKNDGTEICLTKLRGSTGQRKLACILVRLALAQTFTRNSILCLDEPTSNLDSETKDSLANYLSLLIENNNHQTQWIIISHDKDFLEKMNINCDVGYRITKNRYSEIKRKNAGGDDQNTPNKKKKIKINKF